MDIRQMKLALTVDLMNLNASQNPVHFAVERMGDFQSETGNFQEILETNKSKINDQIDKVSLALRFERCTLNLDLIEDQGKKEGYLQSFNLLENIP